jgi:shikimate dehydrogenase
VFLEPKFKLGLIGRHIQYSLSPILHHSFMRVTGKNYVYELFDIEPDAMSDFLKHDGCYNVTTPYKETVFPYCHTLTDEASLCGVVNTIIVHNKHITGHNTDILAVCDLLKPYPLNNVMIFGNGGVVKGIIPALRQLGVEIIYIIGRTPKTIHGIDTTSFEQLKNLGFMDLCINTIPLTSWEDVPLPNLTPNGVLFDCCYGTSGSFFDGFKKEHQTIKGMEMLVIQASYAFDFWNTHVDNF